MVVEQMQTVVMLIAELAFSTAIDFKTGKRGVKAALFYYLYVKRNLTTNLNKNIELA